MLHTCVLNRRDVSTAVVHSGNRRSEDHETSNKQDGQGTEQLHVVRRVLLSV